MDVRRYDADIAALAQAAADRGATIILLTDVLMSPIASIAQVVLPVRVDAPSPFDTTVALLVIVEALATAAIASAWRRRGAAHARLGHHRRRPALRRAACHAKPIAPIVIGRGCCTPP